MRAGGPRPFGWWWAKFLENMRSPEHCTFNEFEELYYEPTRGFMCWMITARMRELYITKCCGDGAYWRDKAYEMFRYAKEHYGVKYMITCSRRRPEVYTRFFRCSLWKTEEANGEPLYWYITKDTEGMSKWAEAAVQAIPQSENETRTAHR